MCKKGKQTSLAHDLGRLGLAAWVFTAGFGLLVGTAAAAPSPAACAQAVAIEQALRRVDDTLTGQGAGPAVVTLPDPLARGLRHETIRISYEVDVSACADVAQGSLWVFRTGAPYRVYGMVPGAAGEGVADGVVQRMVPLALLNANQRARTLPPIGEGHEVVYNGRIPALYALPPGARTVRIELQTLPYMPYGLVQLEMGNTNAMLQRHSDVLQRVLGYSDAAAAVVTVLGLLLALLWLTRRRDTNLLWLALASGLWGLRGLLYFDNTVPGNPLMFEQLNPINALWAIVLVTLAALHLLQGERGRQRQAVWLVAAVLTAGFALAAVLGQGALLARSATQFVGLCLTLWLGAQMVRAWPARRVARRHLAGMMAVLVTLLASAGHDLLIVAGVLPATSAPYIFWGFVVVLVGFALVSGEYVVMTLARAERSNEELEQRVAAKSSELARSYQRLRSTEIAAARDNARTQEREHLLREMHDGIGAQLMTALRGVERGALSRHELAASLQDGLDELRLLMDSTAVMGQQQYLPGALAAWRNRWDARLAAAGVTLAWSIDEALDTVQLDSQAALQIMRILQEAATNVVKHSQAAHMQFAATLQTGADGRALCIEIVDNGIGLGLGGEPVRHGARGVKNMHYRAEQIGATLTVLARQAPAAGCCVRLRLALPAG